MASLRRVPGSKNWIACYTDADGRQRQRSTGTSDRGEALRVAESYEAAWRQQKTETQIRATLSEISERLNGSAIPAIAVAQWCDDWLARVKPEVKPRTFDRYGEAVALIRRLAPEFCAKRVDRFTASDVYDLRAKLAAARSATTTNQTLKIFRMCMKRARAAGLRLDNPAADVPPVKREAGVSVGKQPFTVDQLRALLKLADDEWRGMILAGLYSAGQRLADIATMKAGQVDLRQKAARFSTGKTGRIVILPIAPPWLKDLRARLKGLKPDAPIFPTANGRCIAANGSAAQNSNAFRVLLKNAGLASSPTKPAPGAVPGRRKMQPYSFHSLRHTATSMLKNAGVSDVIARDLVGHDSRAVSQLYTHIDDATKRAALEKLPKL